MEGEIYLVTAQVASALIRHLGQALDTVQRLGDRVAHYPRHEAPFAIEAEGTGVKQGIVRASLDGIGSVYRQRAKLLKCFSDRCQESADIRSVTSALFP